MNIYARRLTAILTLFAIAMLSRSPSRSVAAQERAGRDVAFDAVTLEAAVRDLAAEQCLSVEFDRQAEDFARSKRVKLRLSHTTPAAALGRLLYLEPLRYEFPDAEHLLVFAGEYVLKEKLGQRLRLVRYAGDLKNLIRQMAQEAGVEIDEEKSASALSQGRQIRFAINDASPLRVLQSLLAQERLSYEREGCGPITIVKDTTADSR